MPSQSVVILPSNVRHPFEGINYISKYLTRLSEPLDTKEAFVGLKELTFLNSINNVPDAKWTKFYVDLNLAISTQGAPLNFSLYKQKPHLVLGDTPISL